MGLISYRPPLPFVALFVTGGSGKHFENMNAKLLQPVRRRKPSLAGMFYTLQPGETVYVAQYLGREALLSDVEDPKQRISEDFFTLPFDHFEVTGGDK